MKIESMIITAAPQKKKRLLYRLWKCSYNSVIINYSWKMRTWNEIFIYLHGKEEDPFHFRFHYGLYQVRRFACAWKYPFCIHWVLHCFHCTHKRPLWDLRKNNFALSCSGYFHSQDDMQNFHYNDFDRRHKFTSGHSPPH